MFKSSDFVLLGAKIKVPAERKKFNHFSCFNKNSGNSTSVHTVTLYCPSKKYNFLFSVILNRNSLENTLFMVIGNHDSHFKTLLTVLYLVFSH